MKLQMIVAIQEHTTPLPKGEILRVLGVEMLPGIGGSLARHFICLIEKED